MLVEFVCQSIYPSRKRTGAQCVHLDMQNLIKPLWSYLDTADLSLYSCQSYSCHLTTDGV